jgi:prolyl-tRNA synthetase
VRRISGTKGSVPLAGAAKAVTDAIDEQQAELLAEATARRDDHVTDVTTLVDAAEAASTGWARLPWAQVGVEGEAQLATQSVTVRCLLRPDGTVPEAEDESDLVAIVARSY